MRPGGGSPEVASGSAPVDVRSTFQPDLLRGKIALVTGGGTGIGLIIARALGQVGAHTVLAARDTERLAAAAAGLAVEGLSASWKELNIRDADRVFAVVEEVVAERGAVDVLINNAGGQFPKRAEDLTPGGWRAVVDLNLNGTFYCCLAAGRRMIDSGRGGKIVNVVLSSAERPTPGVAHSGAARAGVVHLTRTLAVEWARFGVQVNAVAPLYLSESARGVYGDAVGEAIASITPMGRWATDREVALTAVALASGLTDYVTGIMLPVDGGNWLGGGIAFRGTSVLPEESGTPRHDESLSPASDRSPRLESDANTSGRG